MGNYRRLDLSKISFAGIKTTDEVLKDVDPIEFPENVLNRTKKISITKAERDVNNKCVKLEISY